MTLRVMEKLIAALDQRTWSLEPGAWGCGRSLRYDQGHAKAVPGESRRPAEPPAPPPPEVEPIPAAGSRKP
jgi:hypothetical protein